MVAVWREELVEYDEQFGPETTTYEPLTRYNFTQALLLTVV